MLVIKAKEGESIDRMLRRYKRKHRDVKLKYQLRDKQFFTKPSERRKKQIAKARYMNQKAIEWER